MFVYVVSVFGTFDREHSIKLFSNEKDAKKFFKEEIAKNKELYRDCEYYDFNGGKTGCCIDYESTFEEGSIIIKIEKQEVIGGKSE